MLRLGKFGKDCRGNVGIMLALVIIPILVAAGAGIDMLRQNNAQTILQSATDAAAIAGASSGSQAPGFLKKIAEDYLKTNHAIDALTVVDTLETNLDTKQRTFSVTLAGKIDTTLMSLVGINQMDVGAFSEVSLTSNGIEVALVLDNTGSMNQGTRLPTLKSSAKALVNEVLSKSGSSYARVGVVPFSEYVNVGMGNRNATWIAVPADTTTTQNICSDTYPNAVASNCRMVPGVGYKDGVPYNYTYKVCDWNYGAPVQQCRTYKNTTTWGGCVGSRSVTLDTRIDQLNKPYPGVQNVRCPAPLIGLSDNPAALNSSIDGMVATGSTYIPSGLLWGWNLLDEGDPITGAKSKSWMKANGGTKALVLMTDGDNTLSADYPYHWGNNTDLANSKVTELCDNIKGDGITVYTVSLSVTNPVSQAMLNNCASDPKKAFAASDPAELANAFKQITESLMAMRLTR